MKFHKLLHNSFKFIYYLISLSILISFIMNKHLIAASQDLEVQNTINIANLADEVKNSVVNISTTQVIEGTPLQPFFGPDSPFWDFFRGDIPQKNRKTHSLGSGLIIDHDGHILTNNHLVEKATAIKVKLHNGKEYDATIIGQDKKTDLVLIQIKTDSDLPKPAILGDSDTIRVGNWVMAIGNPFGLGHTVTVGIISAKGRVIGAGPYDDFLQTDAAINPGNSGGPLFNMAGEVIGINSVLVDEGQGISFAIPINLVRELLPQLKSGKVVRGWVGIMFQDLTPKLTKYFNLKETKGVLISDVVQGSPADLAGLKRGDVIYKLDGKEVKNAHILSRLLLKTPPNAQIIIDIIRNEKEKTIKIVLSITEDEEEEVEQTTTVEIAWGFSVQNTTPELVRNIGFDEKESGVIVTDIISGSSADEAGIKLDDLIKEANHHEIQNIDHFIQVIEKANSNEDLFLLIKRKDSTFYVVLVPAQLQQPF